MKINIIIIVISLFFTSIVYPNTTNSNESVIFVIPIEKNIFNQNTNIAIKLYNSQQIQILEQNSSCTASYNSQTKSEKTVCQNGRKYSQVIPEKFILPITKINEDIRLTSKILKIGEKYRLSISGLSDDNCNTTSTQIIDTANLNTIKIKGIMWLTTTRNCLP